MYLSKNQIPFLTLKNMREMQEGETPASVHPLKTQPVTPAKGQKVILHAKISPP